MATRDYVVDVAVYQSTSMSAYKRAGARQAIVKLTEGTGYFNPKASAQIKSVHANHMYLHGYHFATFGNSISRAKAEARFFINRAKKLNISKKRYLWLDWETGDGNVVVNSIYSNTRAIIAFMDIVKSAGYKVGLYSGAYALRQHVDTAKIVKKFGTCLWVASYATTGRLDKPNFGYFPSMNGVALWQFTDNWHGLNVDGNISLVDLHAEKKAQHQAVKPKPAEKIPKIVYAPILYNNPDYMINLRDSNGHATDKYIQTNTKWRVIKAKMIKGNKYYCLGTDKQWVPSKFLQVIK